MVLALNHGCLGTKVGGAPCLGWKMPRPQAFPGQQANPRHTSFRPGAPPSHHYILLHLCLSGGLIVRFGNQEMQTTLGGPHPSPEP